MNAIVNYHVIDPTNVGDLLSSPANYFSFPGYSIAQHDIRDLNPNLLKGEHSLIGGGGLLYSRFLDSITTLKKASNRGCLIAWGIGQQDYHALSANPQPFDYSNYLNDFDLVGIRDFNSGYPWVPCVSCMHSAFDRKRDIKHEFVVFSHKKFQLKIGAFPRMTNETQGIEEVLDFLGSGETILTSSYHGAYWGTLLGRKVLAFPFSSKFLTFKHSPGLYPVEKWTQTKFQLKLFNHVFYELRDKNQYTCRIHNWREYVQHCQLYPDSLEECRTQNRLFHTKVMQCLSESC
ncbi:MAG: hypothetical protein HC881_00755 [Leptolyngbyaceae cyanobacterium SL_7_1]|nr:hypothetical protein [Leptolyngbyaceae cyanobacterium SL_7_1]